MQGLSAAATLEIWEAVEPLGPVLWRLGEGLEIVGYYHSHPDHPAVPSAYDTAHAWPWYSYLIVRIEQGQPREAASYTLDPDRPLMHPEPLEVLSEV